MPWKPRIFREESDLKSWKSEANSELLLLIAALSIAVDFKISGVGRGNVGRRRDDSYRLKMDLFFLVSLLQTQPFSLEEIVRDRLPQVVDSSHEFYHNSTVKV